jgi:hypothetical protein
LGKQNGYAVVFLERGHVQDSLRDWRSDGAASSVISTVLCAVLRQRANWAWSKTWCSSVPVCGEFWEHWAGHQKQVFVLLRQEIN